MWELESVEMDCLSVEEAQVLISKVNGAMRSAEWETATECKTQSPIDPSGCPTLLIPMVIIGTGKFTRQDLGHWMMA